ncbi:MAG: hypothetical protein KJP21_00885 [Bacteroidia bacterium]|nr:hypothetical protein [Bacteroidia bacterium]NNJ56826.1 hypothetical protein [Bacteroidia bacterium]
MRKILFGFAFLTHPVLIPFYSLLIYWPFLGKYDPLPLILFATWILFVHIILPVFYLHSVKKVDLKEPSINDRKSIYKGYTVLNMILSFVSLIVIKEYFAFLVSLALLNLFLYLLASVQLKASWHTSSWALLVVASLIEWYSFGFTFAPLYTLIIFLLAVGVFLTRWKQEAHTLFELTMGLASGATAAAILFFI